MDNKELIKKAASVIYKRRIGSYDVGDVGCALISSDDNVYTGIDIETMSSMGFCAEHSAIAEMVKAGQHKIRKIVATWKDEDGNLYVIPPCGRCRELMKQIDKGNLETDVILSEDTVVKLKELLPYHDSWEKISSS